MGIGISGCCCSNCCGEEIVSIAVGDTICFTISGLVNDGCTNCDDFHGENCAEHDALPEVWCWMGRIPSCGYALDSCEEGEPIGGVWRYFQILDTDTEPDTYWNVLQFHYNQPQDDEDWNQQIFVGCSHQYSEGKRVGGTKEWVILPSELGFLSSVDGPACDWTNFKIECQSFYKIDGEE